MDFAFSVMKNVIKILLVLAFSSHRAKVCLGIHAFSPSSALWGHKLSAGEIKVMKGSLRYWATGILNASQGEDFYTDFLGSEENRTLSSWPAEAFASSWL